MRVQFLSPSQQYTPYLEVIFGNNEFSDRWGRIFCFNEKVVVVWIVHIFHLFFTTTVQRKKYYSLCFSDEETGVQRVNFPTAPQVKVVFSLPGLEIR